MCEIKFVSSIENFNICIFNTIRVYTSDKTSWLKQITPVKDNFYRILKEFQKIQEFWESFQAQNIEMTVNP